jgi:N-acetyl sugar amidotransferase
MMEYRVLRGPEGARRLEERISAIKRAGKGREYDCVIGVSGGVDSTYVALLCKEHGLRPLAVHLDNGWDSELAVKNIHNCLERLDIDLETHVIDWFEFRDLQLSFLRASVPDGEIPTDHAIQATMWQSAARVGVKTIVSGMNFATESSADPIEWAYGHQDWRYIKDVHSRFGSVPLKTYPHFRIDYLLRVNGIRRVRTMSILNYMEFDKAAVQSRLVAELGWQDYGGKHHESIYTRFFQGYVLPTKFGIDKRYSHLSDLIRAEQITRDDALLELAKPPYDPELQRQDLIYVSKKLGLTPAEFDDLMALPIKSFRDYRNNYDRVMLLKKTVNIMRARGLYDL